MTGPSSSHTAAPTRIGKLAAQLLRGNLQKAAVTFETNGSFAACYQTQLSDKGFIGGFLGWNPEDPRVPMAEDYAKAQNVTITFQTESFLAEHPNTARIILESEFGEVVKLVALSTGGGMLEIIEIDGFQVSIAGDFYEILLVGNAEQAGNICRRLTDENFCGQVCESSVGYRTLLDIKTSHPVPFAMLAELESIVGAETIRCLSPVLPVVSQIACRVPFCTAASMLAKASPDAELWELAVEYESARGGISEKEVFDKTKNIVRTMKAAIELGLSGSLKMERILKPQAQLIEKAKHKNLLIPLGSMNTVISWSMATTEVNSAMGVVVAAPTAGSAGVIPGAILGMAKEMGLDEEAEAKAIVAAGLIGVFIAEQATFAAEICGCQAECGAASCMAAAGVVQLANGTARQSVAAASIAMQNVLGMVCDPVGGLVEVPCLGKNVMGAVNAVSVANMALAGVEEIIPLDEAIKAMFEVGKMLPPELCCTGRGGLATTPTAGNIARQLNLRQRING